MSDVSTQKLLEELKTLRDEIRLKIHLGGMEARTALEGLEGDLREIERHVKIAGGKLKTSFQKLRDELIVRD